MQPYLKALILILLLTFNLIQGKSQTLGFELDNGAKRVDIPFEIYNNLIVIPVVINDRLPLKFVLDTGVRTSILTEKTFATLIGLKYSKEYSITGLGEGKLIKAYISNSVSLKLPGVSGKGHAILVLEEDYLELRNYLGAEVNGVLGYEIFSRFIVKIDYDRRVLTLYKPEKFKPRKSWLKVPISIEDTKPYVTGTIVYPDNKEIDLKLLVDTGSSHGLILNEETHPDITIPEEHIETSLGRGLAGKLDGKIARLRAFQLGGACWEDLIATFPDQNPWLDSLMMNEVDRNGSVGGEILTRFKVIFNFPLETMYIKKGKHFKKEFTYNLSGIVIKAIGSNLDIFEVVEIRNNSVSDEAGLAPGDRILKINNKSTSSMTLDNLIEQLNSKPGKKIKLTISRGLDTFTTKLVLREEI